jgi:hypothetical protein
MTWPRAKAVIDNSRTRKTSREIGDFERILALLMTSDKAGKEQDCNWNGSSYDDPPVNWGKQCQTAGEDPENLCESLQMSQKNEFLFRGYE